MFKRVFSSFVIVLFVAVSINYASAGFFTMHRKVKETGGEIVIPIKKINDGEAHYFIYKGNNQVVKFFVVKSQDNVIRAAFDACDVCFPSKKGYSQSGDYMICNNCGRKFHSNRINVIQGGCNPAPLKRIVRGENLVIRVDHALEGSRYF